MIKHAEVQNAYLQGRQAAMIKLSEDKLTQNEVDNILAKEDGQIGPGQGDESALQNLLAAQGSIAGNVGLGTQGLTRGDKSLAAYDPRQLATLENLSRAGMLAGAGGGAYLGGMDPRAAAIASAGALGGGLVGGNLGAGLQAALAAYGTHGTGRGPDQRMMESIGGGLGAGYLAR